MTIKDVSHSRKNLLTDEWVLVSPNRTMRPWQGQIEVTENSEGQMYDADCYLCPGNERANGEHNPNYSNSYSFQNDFSALSETSAEDNDAESLFVNRAESGTCRVVCYSAGHSQRITTMPEEEVVRAVTALFEEFQTLDASGDYQYVQMFENRGQMMGCSNQHPHAQVWATEHLPNEPRKELRTQQAYFDKHASPLLLDYLHAELADGERIVCEGEHFVSLVPYWAVWPFETMILPRKPAAEPMQLSTSELQSLAAVLQQTIQKYENLFLTETPYSMGFHPRPSDGKAHPEWLFHAHIYPPLLRSASIRKHLVGFEMLAMPQRDITPEVAAERLRNASTANSKV